MDHPPDDLLRRGIEACKAGRKAEARTLLWKHIEQDRQSETAWLWLSAAVETDHDRRLCLERVLAINPANEAARRGLERLQSTRSGGPAGAPPQAMPKPAPASTTDKQDLAPPSAAVTPRVQPPGSPPKSTEAARFGRILLIGALSLVFIVICAVVYFLLTAPKSADKLSQETKDRIAAVVYENLAANNAEDVERYMATIHSKSPSYQQTRDVITQLYPLYDLYQTIEGVQVLQASNSEARVSFVITTRKINGPAFRDNRITGVMILRTENGQWKIYNQKVDNLEYLN